MGRRLESISSFDRPAIAFLPYLTHPSQEVNPMDQLERREFDVLAEKVADHEKRILELEYHTGLKERPAVVVPPVAASELQPSPALSPDAVAALKKLLGLP